MANEIVQASAPGKLILSGEWAVLEPGNPAVVAAVNRRASCQLRKRQDQKFLIKTPAVELRGIVTEAGLQLEQSLSPDEQQALVFVKNAIETTFDFLDRRFGFELVTKSDGLKISSDAGQYKLGFGSSAAISVAVIAAFLRSVEQEVSSDEARLLVFKLAAISHYLSQGCAGSGLDIAAASFGGVLAYERFLPGILNDIDRSELQNLIAADWPGLEMRHLPQSRVNVLVGWSGVSASTTELLQALQAWKVSHLDRYQQCIERIGLCARDFESAWQSSDEHSLLKTVHNNQLALQELAESSGCALVTPALGRLVDIARNNGAAGKISGAGGGDCGIAFASTIEMSDLIRHEWEQQGICFIDVSIDPIGVRVAPA